MTQPAELTFKVSLDDQDEFGRLTLNTQKHLTLTLDCIKVLHAAGDGHMRKAYAGMAGLLFGHGGFTYGSLHRKLLQYRKAGDWRVLINKSRANGARGLPEPFIDFWQGLYNSNQRNLSGRACRRKLLDIWFGGDAIPGYGSFRDYWRKKHPQEPLPDVCPQWFVPSGWEYSSLMRRKPKPAEVSLVKLGIAAAQHELLHVPQTRRGMRFLEWITIDDVRTDWLIHALGWDEPLELKCLYGKDISCDLSLRFGSRPAFPQKDGSKEGIRRHDTLVLLAGILRTWGYPLDYIMNIIVERGTATLTEDDAAALADLSDGHIVVHWTEMIRGRALPHSFDDRAIGNPNGKSWLESSLNLFHNEMGFVRGQTGALYQRRPAELAGRAAELKAIEKADKFLTPEQRAKIRRPFLNLVEAQLCIAEMFIRMDGRIDHKLEEFEDIGIWRWKNDLQSPWRPMDEYPIGLPAGAEKDIILTTRPEKPIERMKKISAGYRFARIPESRLPLLLEMHHSLVRVEGGVIEIQIDNKPYRFRDEKSGLMKEEAEYLAYYSRADIQCAAAGSNRKTDLAALYLTDGKKAYLGRLPLWTGVTRGDVERLAEVQAEKSRALKAVRVAVGKGMQYQAQQRLEEVQNQIDVYTEAVALNPANVPGEAAPGSLDAMAAEVRASAERAADTTKVSIVDITRAKAKRAAQS